MSKGAELAEAHLTIAGSVSSTLTEEDLINNESKCHVHVYILRNPKNYLYVGSSSDVDERVLRHNAGQGAEFTKRNKDFKLVYEEKHPTLLEASRKEF